MAEVSIPFRRTFHVYGNIAFGIYLLQSFGEVGHVVELLFGRVVVQVDVGRLAVLAGVVPREKAHLLGRAPHLCLV